MSAKKIIRVSVGPKGETKVETKDIAGGGCREASRFLEQALGQPVGEQLTAEFYQSGTTEQQIRQSQ
jgi:hypothetical protein